MRFEKAIEELRAALRAVHEARTAMQTLDFTEALAQAPRLTFIEALMQVHLGKTVRWYKGGGWGTYYLRQVDGVYEYHEGEAENGPKWLKVGSIGVEKLEARWGVIGAPINATESHESINSALDGYI